MYRFVFLCLFASLLCYHDCCGQESRREARVESESSPPPLPDDPRRGELVNLDGYFPFHPVANADQWEQRSAEIRRRILVSQGLWPLPTKAPLNAMIHGRVDRDDYVVDRVYFESIPGHFVTGSLYRPKDKRGPFPAILSPHGHWNQGRFYDAGEQTVKNQIASGAEQDMVGGRYPIQARAVQLARMGCLVFVYDMTGNADSIQISHRPAKWSHLDTPEDWGFMSVQAELRLQNMMGLQTWNSIRAIDFLLELDDVDRSRIGVTGASGGGTQSMLISAVDDRISAAMPCVMVSTAMQGGCTCENAPLLRIDQGNIDIAAATAPRPLGLTAADDWTIELETKGFPELVRLYELLGHSDRLMAVFHTEFKHNYNLVNRKAMYGFFNRHFGLGLKEPIDELPYQPLSKQEATVWNDEHPAPSGEQVGDAHEIRLLKTATADSDRRLGDLVANSESDPARFQTVVGGGWQTILARRLDQVGEVHWVSSADQDERENPQSGYLVGAENNEWVAVSRFLPRGKSRGTVVLVTDRGLASVQPRQAFRDQVDRFVDAGFALIVADRLGQADPSIESQPMWYQGKGEQGWQRFSGYTYGYNHSLFVKRVHDILSMIAFASAGSDTPTHLIGLGSVAGPLVTAARSQAGDRVEKTIVRLDRFRFRDLRRHEDPMFVPGAVKYLDVDGLLATCAPAEVRLVGSESLPVAEKIYAALGKSQSLRRVPQEADLVRLIDAPKSGLAQP